MPGMSRLVLVALALLAAAFDALAEK